MAHKVTVYFPNSSKIAFEVGINGVTDIETVANSVHVKHLDKSNDVSFYNMPTSVGSVDIDSMRVADPLPE